VSALLILAIVLAGAWLWAEIRALIHHADADHHRLIAGDRAWQIIHQQGIIRDLEAGQLGSAPVYDQMADEWSAS
jgi:hypothetical protein